MASGDGGSASGSARLTGGAASSRQAVAWSLATGNAPTNLHPAGRTGSELFGTTDALFVGWTTDSGGTSRATLWDRAASNVSKELGGSFTESRVYGVSGKLLAGQGRPSGGTMHAIVWDRDAADAPTDLNGSFTASSAYGVSGPRLVGFGATATGDHAVLWTSASASSAVDLHPSGATSSTARGLAGNIVAGSTTVGGASHAGFWNLATGNAFTDLTPTGGGAAYATNGRFVVGTTGGRAGFTSLTPESANFSRAALWDRDNGNKLVDLHATYLNDQGFEWSAALGVDTAGNVYGVGGAVVDDFNASYRAWVLVKQ